MNREYIIKLISELDFPKEATHYFVNCIQKIDSLCHEDFDGAVEFYRDNSFDIKLTAPLLDEIAVKTDIHRYTADMLMLLSSTEALRAAYAELNISDKIFIDTMCDFRFKLYECHEVYGIWGTFVGFWYDIFYSLDLVKLGRLEYENYKYDSDIPYEACGLKIEKGYPVKSIHIPSHAGPLTAEARLDSYKLAYEFFSEELHGKPLVCTCHSWLLHSSTRAILPAESNTVSFMNDFDIMPDEDFEKFNDLWRVFGNYTDDDYGNLPENTSMQRAYKSWLLKDGKIGAALGILIFDGEKIINTGNTK